jgi:arginase
MAAGAPITLVAVPYSLDRRGEGLGRTPAALAAAGLVGALESDGCAVEWVELAPILPENRSVEARLGVLLAELAATVAAARSAGRFPIVLGGDCMTALGTLAGLGDGPGTGVAWFDAHGDFNTPEITRTGYLGGMPLACAVGRGLAELRRACGLDPPAREESVALIGARDLDPLEAEALAASAVLHVEVAEVPAGRFRQALERFAQVRRIYLHLDMDALDPSVAPGVGYPTPAGLSRDQIDAALNALASRDQLGAFAVTSIRVERDQAGRTVALARDLVRSVAGRVRSARRDRP